MEDETDKAIKKESSKQKKIIIALACIVLAVLGGLAYGSYNNHSSNEPIVKISPGVSKESQLQSKIDDLTRQLNDERIKNAYDIYQSTTLKCKVGIKISAENLTNPIGIPITQTGFYIVSNDNISCSNLVSQCEKHYPVCEYYNDTSSCLCNSFASINWGKGLNDSTRARFLIKNSSINELTNVKDKK